MKPFGEFSRKVITSMEITRSSDVKLINHICLKSHADTTAIQIYVNKFTKEPLYTF